MNIITVTGYYGTGSSAVTDLISEFENVESIGDYEIRLLHDPNGISDLEFRIIENFNRHNSSYGIKKFLWYAKFLNSVCGYKKYEKIFNGKFLKYTEEYVNQIVRFKSKGYWHYDVIDKGITYYIVERILNKLINKINNIIGKKIILPVNVLSNNDCVIYGVCNDRENFLLATRRYIKQLLLELNVNNKEFLMVDQIVASSNIKRYLKYFDDPISIILVDRDPRDLYILDKVYWGGNGFPKDVKEFCEYYKLIRCTKNIELQNKEVLGIQFEDLIYKYEITKNNILDFLNLDTKDHKYMLKYFNPSISINNTQLWKKHPEFCKEIKYIEMNLKEYLYDYSNIQKPLFDTGVF